MTVIIISFSLFCLWLEWWSWSDFNPKKKWSTSITVLSCNSLFFFLRFRSPRLTSLPLHTGLLVHWYLLLLDMITTGIFRAWEQIKFWRNATKFPSWKLFVSKYSVSLRRRLLLLLQLTVHFLCSSFFYEHERYLSSFRVFHAVLCGSEKTRWKSETKKNFQLNRARPKEKVCQALEQDNSNDQNLLSFTLEVIPDKDTTGDERKKKLRKKSIHLNFHSVPLTFVFDSSHLLLVYSSLFSASTSSLASQSNSLFIL